MSVAAAGGIFPNMNILKEQGLMPRAPNPIRLSDEERVSIPTQRPLKAVYVGTFGADATTNSTRLTMVHEYRIKLFMTP